VSKQSARDRLAEAAFALFAERGYEQTSIDDITERAGLGRTTFFRHYRTKEDVIFPDHDRLLEQVDSNYAGVIVAAKRARQINSYYHNLGEGTFDEFPPPMVETVSKNYLTIALEEVAAGKMKYHYR